MATDFFERQSAARTSTTWLVGMFLVAVVAIVASVVGIAVAVVQYQLPEPWPPLARHPEQLWIPVAAGVVTLLVIIGGTAFKVVALQSGGGTQVAESLGGKRLYPNSRDPLERKLLNVVEEMAIASGTPVPPVFLLDEKGINAFAAGYSPSDAVLGVTRGCVEQLSRDELQGVIAHEFSHVLNGDMRMSIRLMGILYGLLLLGLTGQLVFRMVFFTGGTRSRRNNDNKGGGGQIVLVIMAVSVALIVVGFVGTFFGNLIKAAVSRQREYLADASAVQFTRNPEGISGALKRIGGSVAGSRLTAPNAAEASHMYFSQGVWEGISGLWATHPPLEKRIRAIEPNWDGNFPKGSAAPVGFSPAGAAGFAGTTGSQSALDEVPAAIVDDAVHHLGDPTEAHQHYATELLASLPEIVLENARDPYGARAIVYALLMDTKPEIRDHQWQALRTHASPDVLRLTEKLMPSIDQLEARARLPLIDVALPALRTITVKQFQVFSQCFAELVKADQRLDLFEWMLSKVLMRHLRTQFEPIRSPGIQYYGLQQLGTPCSILLTVVSRAGNSEAVARAAFEAGSSQMPDVNWSFFAAGEHGLASLQEVLAKLLTVSEKQRGRLVQACTAAICSDDHVTWQEAELLRGISDLLDCPMPPLLITTPTA